MNSYAAMRPRPEGGHSQSIKPEFGVQNQSPVSERERTMLPCWGAKIQKCQSRQAGARRGPERDHGRRARCSHERPLAPWRRDQRGLPRGQQHGQCGLQRGSSAFSSEVGRASCSSNGKISSASSPHVCSLVDWPGSVVTIVVPFLCQRGI